MNKRFEGKSVLVTGASSGIGLAAAQAFAAEGAHVVITGRDAGTLAEAAARIGGRVTPVVNDAADPGGPTALAQTLAASGVALDAVFLNAGAARFAALPDVTPALWDEIFATNVKGA